MFLKASSPDGAWSWDTFMSPFSKKMWFVTVANILFSSLVLYTTHHFRASRRKETKNEKRYDNTKEENQLNLANSFFTAFSATVQQGRIIKIILHFCIY